MSLSDEEREAIVFYKKQKARNTLDEAIGIAELGYWNAVLNRLYYACYYATTALLVHHGLSAHTHSGVIRLFGLQFIIKGLISKEQGKFYSRLFELRQIGDYDDFYSFSEQEVQPLIEPAIKFITTIESLLQ